MHLLLFVVGFLVNYLCQASDLNFKSSVSKVCVIPEYRTTHLNSAYSYRFLKRYLELEKGCTHIHGDLHIVELTPNADGIDPDISFLESIEEIYGRLIIHGNSVRRIPLTNLKVIRGISSSKDKNSLEIYLNMVKDNSSNFHVDLQNLRVVMNGNIYLSENQGYLESRVDWNQILDDPLTQEVKIIKTTISKNINFPCHNDCEFWKSDSGNYSQFCFGPLKNQCQPKTKCKTTKNFKWCRFSKDGEIPCNHECAGGCHGGKPTDCAACNKFFKNSTCSSTCAPKTNLIYGKDTSKNSVDKYIYTVGGFCSDHCPGGLLDQDKVCIYECNFDKYYKSGNRCIECPSGSCDIFSVKDNRICDLSKLDPLYPKNERKYVLNAQILRDLTNCTTILGSLNIEDASFLDHNISIPMLYKHLKSVREIFGELSIFTSEIPIKNLTFLSNLEEIRRSVKFTNQQYPLKIHGKYLEFLGLKKLKSVYGSVLIYGEKNLCYLNKIPWQDISFDTRTVFSCNISCDPLCTRGCWGPGNKFCYSCSHLEAGDNCVKQCSDSPGYYSSFPSLNNTVMDQTQCRKCHPLCKQNCTGPTVRDCGNQCLHAIENGVCVKTCSLGYYPLKQNITDHIICEKCHKSCYVDNHAKGFACTGPSDIFGIGGCSMCRKIIKTGLNNTTRCHDGPCPPSFVKAVIPDKHNYDSRIIEQSSCEPCHQLCKNCTGLGNHRHVCSFCNGYFYNNRCISTCPIEVKNDTSKIELGSNCPRCHQQCKNGCFKANDNSSCLECVNKKLVHNAEDNKFSCVTQCPPHRNYTEFHNGELLCLSLAETSYSHQKRIILFILIGCISGFVVLFVLFVLYFKWRSNQAKMAAECKALYSNYNEPNTKNMKEDHITRPPNTRRLQMIPVSDLIFDTSAKPLGSGAFGKVYRGYWKVPNFENKTHNLDVVIKVIYNSSKASTDEFLEEAKIMASVAHRHCLPLIGVCLSLDKPCLVSTYAEYGSLDKYLHQYSKKISSYSMLQWAEQVADGMAYLSLRGIVHRDLAARNVLVNSKNIIQITDFGLARLVGDSEESIIVKSGRVPIRWLSLETLLHATYSSSTDVWAYGVTLWEIFTYGKRPYEDLESNEITTYLLQGNRLCQPEICTLDVYMVMIKCWLHDPHMRPSFKELMLIFQQYSQSPRRFLYLPHEHVNKPLSKNNSIMKMHQISVDSEIRPPSTINRSDEISWGAALHNDSAYHLVSNSYSKEQNEDKSFLPRRKRPKRNISLNKIRSFSKLDLTRLLASRLQRDSKSFNYKPTDTYDGSKTTCTSIDSMIPLFTTRSCEYDGQQPINPQIAKIKMEIRKCCPNNHISEGSYKAENQSPTPERIFFDKENKCSLEIKPIIQKPGNKSSNLPPIDIPHLLSQSSSIIEPTRISIDNQNKNSPDSGNSHNFDMARDSDDYLIPSHISSAGYYNLTPSPSSIIKHSGNLNDSPLMAHDQNYDDGYLEPKRN